MKTHVNYLVLFPIFLAVTFDTIQEKSLLALQSGKLKEAEACYIEFIETASNEEISRAKSELAILYYRDQEQEKAFRIFLEALDFKPSINASPSKEENEIYESALKIYLENVGNSPEETALRLKAQFATISEENPQFYLLGFLLAVAEANLGNYEQFFKKFYKSYIHYPQHFLVYKAKAALHIKLFERAKDEQEREKERDLILKNAKEASSIQPYDSSLYRMILGFTPESSKSEALTTYLNKIINQNIVVARIDIPYYVEVAIAFKQYELAQNFLNKAKQWYSYSRVINVAQEYLNEQRSQK